MKKPKKSKEAPEFKMQMQFGPAGVVLTLHNVKIGQEEAASKFMWDTFLAWRTQAKKDIRKAKILERDMAEIARQVMNSPKNIKQRKDSGMLA